MITQPEKEILGRFAGDEYTANTVKKMLLEEVSWTGVKEGYSNEQLGEVVRAYEEAKRIIESGFIKMEGYKQVDQKPPKINEAR